MLVYMPCVCAVCCCMDSARFHSADHVLHQLNVYLVFIRGHDVHAPCMSNHWSGNIRCRRCVVPPSSAIFPSTRAINHLFNQVIFLLGFAPSISLSKISHSEYNRQTKSALFTLVFVSL